MNKDIIRMAREAGLHSAVLLHLYDGKEAALTDSERDELRRLGRFAALVIANNPPQTFMSYQEGYAAGVAAEREACAKVCDFEVARLTAIDEPRPALAVGICAAVIRARSKE